MKWLLDNINSAQDVCKHMFVILGTHEKLGTHT